MDLELSEEQRLIVDTTRKFVRNEIVPLEADLDPDATELEPEDRARLVAQVREMGFYGLDIPPEYGGPDIDIVTRTLMAIEMAQHRAGLYTPCYGVFGGAGLAQLFEANEDQKQRYLFPTLRGEKHGFFGLTEPSGGSDPARAIATTRGQRWRRLGPQRREDLHQPGGRGGLRHRLRAHRSGEGAATGSRASSSTTTCRDSTSAGSCTRCVRRAMPPSCSSTTCACRRRTCWAR